MPPGACTTVPIPPAETGAARPRSPVDYAERIQRDAFATVTVPAGYLEGLLQDNRDMSRYILTQVRRFSCHFGERS